MNALDLALISAAILGAMAGSRIGFFRHFALWLGIFLGGLLGIALMPSIAERFAAGSESAAFAAPFLTLLICASIGASLLSALTRSLRSPNSGAAKSLRGFDRIFGALAGVGVIAFITWSIAPVVTASRYWPIEISNESGILKQIKKNGPIIPSSLAEAVETYSKVTEDGLSIPDNEPDPIKGVTPPDPPVMNRSVIAKVSEATLRVEGRACSLIQDGSGVVIARDLVVTNAHVVAGEKGSTTVSNGAIRRSADVVAFDPRRDIAILRIKNLGISPLRVSSPIANATVALFGYPGGRELRVEGGRILDQIEATGADLYGNGEWSRKILILAADLEPGDSGGPVVSRSGLLLGLSFATDPRLPHTSYALDPSEIRAVLNTVRLRTVDTGKCLAK